MLVLSRKVGERVLIGDKIAVTVVRVGPGAVRLGIEAPSDMLVVREELQEGVERAALSSEAVTPEAAVARIKPR